MTKKITYADEPLGDIEVVADFLPSPAELAFREEGVKVTLALSKAVLFFFQDGGIEAPDEIPADDPAAD